jgi:predicted nuclease of restriction endonuclease-like RecB superfamily
MIPSELLRYKIDYKNKINPVFCSLSTETSEYNIAKSIIDIFSKCYKEKKSKEQLDQAIKDLESNHQDYKMIRGLCSIVERRCMFKPKLETECGMNNVSYNVKEPSMRLAPPEIRKMVFEESSANNVAISETKREHILHTISKKLKTDRDKILDLMWSDLDENTVIHSYNAIDPLELLFNYNISLIQTLLFNCIKIEIKIDSEKSVGLIWKNILREVKRLGLMYWLDTYTKDNGTESHGKINNRNERSNNNSIKCTIEGAMNIIKLTERYGNAISRLVPLIFRAERWNLSAEILRISHSGEKKIYIFEASEKSHPDKISFNLLKKLLQESNNNGNKEGKTKDILDLPGEIYYDSSKQVCNIPVTKESKIHHTSPSSSPSSSSPLQQQPLEPSGSAEVIDHRIVSEKKKENIVKPAYDSNVERIFARKFELFNTRWVIEREPEPLITYSKSAFIPDFILTKQRTKVFVEIVGFWTKEYIERKIGKILQTIESYKDPNFYMILIVNHENFGAYETAETNAAAAAAASTSQDIKGSFQDISQKDSDNILIVSYKKENIPFKEIISFLKQIESKGINQKLRNEITVQELIKEISHILIEFINTCGKSQINLAEINETLKSQNNLYEDYDIKEIIKNSMEFEKLFKNKLETNNLAIVSDTVIKRGVIEELSEDLKDKTNLKAACEVLTSKNIPEEIQIELLSYMGFRIEWNGLDYAQSAITQSYDSKAKNN